MAQRATNPRIVQFGRLELDLDARELRKSGVRIKLQEQRLLLSLTAQSSGKRRAMSRYETHIY